MAKIVKHFLSNRYTKWALIISVIAIAAFIWHEQTKAYHFLTVTPGVLYRSGWMQPHAMNEIIRKYGIRTMVNLCLPTEKMSRENNNYVKEQEICRKNAVMLVYLPMVGNTPPTQEQIDQWLNLLQDSSRLPVLVHCAHGVIRTGAMVAIYEMEFLHKSNEKALAELPMFGHKLDDPKRKELCDFLLNYKPRMHTESQSKSEP